MLLKDVKDYLKTLVIADYCYLGMMPDKKEKSFGVYPLKESRKPVIPIGGIKNRSYGVRGISILIHWNNSPTDSEKAARVLYDKLLEVRNANINDSIIKFVMVSSDEPISLNTDDNGIYEYVIECLFYYVKGKVK